PRELPSIPGYEFATSYKTSARAGGDYYDFFPLKTGDWGLFIADVSGHGTPAAVLMAITHAIAHAQPGTHTPPAALPKPLNHHTPGTSEIAEPATLPLLPPRRLLRNGLLRDPQPRDSPFTYSMAGHNPPRLIRGEQVLTLAENGALPLGISEAETYGEATLTL